MQRLAAVDFVRGIAVICMIALHVFDGYAIEPVRRTFYGDVTYYFGGGAAPMFLSLAGLATTLAINKGYGNMIRRGVEIWLLALLFRLQEWALGGDGSFSHWTLRVDVLNCIGLSILLALFVHWLGAKLGHPALALFLVAIVIIFAAPLIAKASWLNDVPPFLRHHLGGPQTFALFPLFPWAGVALLGAALGAFAKDRLADTAKWLLVAYVVILVVRIVFKDALAFQRSNTHPVFTLERTSLSLGLVFVAAEYLKRAQRGASTFVLLGRRSLLIYWVHVELCYGLWFHRFKRGFEPSGVLLATVMMILFCWALAYWLPDLKRKST